MFGQANGHYEAEAWSYSLGRKAMAVYPYLALRRRYQSPWNLYGRLPRTRGIVDAKTFQINPDLQDPQKIITSGLLNDLQQGKTDSVVYSTTEDARWKLPSGHTITFDLIPDKVSLSYTKILGDIEMYHAHAESLSTGGTKT